MGRLMSRTSPLTAPATFRRVRLFAGAADEPRARRAGDVLALTASALTLVVVSALAIPQSRLEIALERVFAALPAI